MRLFTIRNKILLVILGVLLSSGIIIITIWYKVSSDTADMYLRDISESTMRDACHAFEYLLTDTNYMATIIRIITCRSEEKLIITIQDNGAGMTKEQIRQIFETKNRGRKNFNGIGIWNVNERIHLVLGDAYGLHYESVEGKGTRAVFELPAVCRIEEDS